MKKFSLNKIYNQDCLDGMKDIPDEKIDLVITDPPFAIDFKSKKANYNRIASRVLPGYNEIKSKDYYNFTYNIVLVSHVVNYIGKSCFSKKLFNYHIKTSKLFNIFGCVWTLFCDMFGHK